MDNRTVLLILLRRRFQKRKIQNKKRRFWVHPLLKVRYLQGAFYNIFQKLLEDENKFFNYFRMTLSTFQYLVDSLSASIKKKDTIMRLSVPPTEMIALTLRYLASGSTFTELHYTYRLGISTISGIVRTVCREIWSTLLTEYIPMPKEEDWVKIAHEFEEKAHFPHCIGAVDGKHIRVQRFRNSGSMNLNYKHFFSIVLMAIANANYEFIYVDIGGYGKDCDSSIFKRSTFWDMLENKTLNLPSPTKLRETDPLELPFVLVGDEAFGLHENIMRPFGGHNLDDTKRIFNYRLCRARRYVECSFGILSNKWRIFHRALNVNKDLCKDIVKACIVLHNLVRRRDGAHSDDYFVDHRGFQNFSGTEKSRGGRVASEIRNQFAQYFVSPEGSLPWQMSKI